MQGDKMKQKTFAKIHDWLVDETELDLEEKNKIINYITKIYQKEI